MERQGVVARRCSASSWDGNWRFQSAVCGYLHGSASGSEAVACTSASRCWAAGDYTNSSGATRNEILRWHAKIWTEVSAPQPGGTASTDQNNLFWDTCVSSSDCWAVGYIVNTAGDTLNQALHWNGKRWSSK